MNEGSTLSPKTPGRCPLTQIILQVGEITLLLGCVPGNAVVATETPTRFERFRHLPGPQQHV
jgi:hypothetical protein